MRETGKNPNNPTGRFKYEYVCNIDNRMYDKTYHYTPWNDDGMGNSTYLDRHNVSCPNGKVLIEFGLEYNYRIKYGQTITIRNVRELGGRKYLRSRDHDKLIETSHIKDNFEIRRDPGDNRKDEYVKYGDEIIIYSKSRKASLYRTNDKKLFAFGDNIFGAYGEKKFKIESWDGSTGYVSSGVGIKIKHVASGRLFYLLDGGAHGQIVADGDGNQSNRDYRDMQSWVIDPVPGYVRYKYACAYPGMNTHTQPSSENVVSTNEKTCAGIAGDKVRCNNSNQNGESCAVNRHGVCQLQKTCKFIFNIY